MNTPQTIIISARTWQEFIKHFPDAVQWLVLNTNLPVYTLPSLTPNAEPAAFIIHQEDAADVHPNIG